MSNQHARLAPSSMYRLNKCSGSLKLIESLPIGRLVISDTDDAEEGTAAHWLIEQATRSGDAYLDYKAAPNGVEITDEMRDAIPLWLGELPDNPSAWHIEESVNCKVIHPECWGTPDFWTITSDRTLHVYDFKFGFKNVDVYENLQLLAYALGIASDNKVERVMLKIIQPRAYGQSVKKWTLTRAQLELYLPGLQQTCINAVTNGKVSPGTHCEYCPARLACSAFRDSVFGIVDYVSKPQIDIEDVLMIEREFDMLKDMQTMLDARANILKEQLLAFAQAGVKLQRYQLEQGYGRDRWTLELDKLEALGQMFGVNVIKREPITPKQAIKAGIPEEIVRPYYTTPKGELKLKPIGNKLKRIFNHE